jgi:signal transduction histidine kinase
VIYASGAVFARAVRSERFTDWLPAIVLPPALLLSAGLSGRSVTVPVAAIAFIGVAPLIVRRRIAFSALLAPFVAGIVLEVAIVQPGEIVVLVPMVMLYDLARLGDRRRSLWLAGLTVPSVLVSTVPFNHGDALLLAVGQSLVLCMLAIAAGDVLRARQVSVQKTADAREARIHARLAAERLAIAHEIHDTVAHAMTAINVQAGVAAHLIDRDPAQAHIALRAIKQTSGDALTDLRSTLHMLRDPASAAALSPPAVLADIDALADGLREAGISVALCAAPVADLPAVVQAAGYRIIQEATTNIIRHSRADSVSIELRRDAAGIDIDVIDNGVGTEDPVAGGNGVRGMRERAAALGGELTAAPACPHGWHVRARLPIQTGGLA